MLSFVPLCWGQNFELNLITAVSYTHYWFICRRLSKNRLRPATSGIRYEADRNYNKGNLPVNTRRAQFANCALLAIEYLHTVL